MNSKLLGVSFGIFLALSAILIMQVSDANINKERDKDNRNLCEQNKIDFNKPNANCSSQ